MVNGRSVWLRALPGWSVSERGAVRRRGRLCERLWRPAHLPGFGNLLEDLRALSPTRSGRGGGEVWRIEIAFDTGQCGGGFLGCVAVVQRLPRALHFLQDLVGGGFPVNGLGVLIPSVEKLSNILLQCLDRSHRSVLQAFPVHFPV